MNRPTESRLFGVRGRPYPGGSGGAGRDGVRWRLTHIHRCRQLRDFTGHFVPVPLTELSSVQGPPGMQRPFRDGFTWLSVLTAAVLTVETTLIAHLLI